MQQADEISKIDARANRLVAGVIALVSSAPLVFAALLTPSKAGMGTHMQLGLPDCGFKVVTGLPCATCGCTTAFAHAADGALLTSFLTQPFGAVLALTLAMLTLVSLWSLWSGMSLGPIGGVIASKRAMIGWAVLLLAAWAYKAGAVMMANTAAGGG